MNQNNTDAPEAIAGAAKQKEPSPGQELNKAIYDIHPFKDASRRYLIFSSQRTGSNYLCRRLCNVKDHFGLPSEYLHPKAIQMMSPRLIAQTDEKRNIPLGKYMRALERARTTEDGYFGIKAQPAQLLAALGRQEKMLPRFVERFDRIVLMNRRDKLGQAISGAVAQATGKWFNDGTGAAMDTAYITSLFPLIAQNLARYIEEERMIFRIGKMVSKPLLRIEYEEIERDGEAAFRNLVDFLSGGEEMQLDQDTSIPVPEKQPGDLANAIRERFLEYISGR
jgi:LPS sulfotransferase NodH